MRSCDKYRNKKSGLYMIVTGPRRSRGPVAYICRPLFEFLYLSQDRKFYPYILYSTITFYFAGPIFLYRTCWPGPIFLYSIIIIFLWRFCLLLIGIQFLPYIPSQEKKFSPIFLHRNILVVKANTYNYYMQKIVQNRMENNYYTIYNIGGKFCSCWTNVGTQKMVYIFPQELGCASSLWPI